MLSLTASGWEAFVPVYESPLGAILFLERRLAGDRLALNCERGIVEVDVSRLPVVSEHAQLATDGTTAIVGRLGDDGFAVARGRKSEWGLHDMEPAMLIRARRATLAAVGKHLDKLPIE
jgi:hypothetical protein